MARKTSENQTANDFGLEEKKIEGHETPVFGENGDGDTPSLLGCHENLGKGRPPPPPPDHHENHAPHLGRWPTNAHPHLNMIRGRRATTDRRPRCLCVCLSVWHSRIGHRKCPSQIMQKLSNDKKYDATETHPSLWRTPSFIRELGTAPPVAAPSCPTPPPQSGGCLGRGAMEAAPWQVPCHGEGEGRDGPLRCGVRALGARDGPGGPPTNPKYGMTRWVR